MPEKDILIIGGGPGGLSTALHITRDYPHLAPRVLVLEKARYPRHKLCAGELVFDAEILLQRLGLDVSEVPHVDADRIHFDFEAREVCRHPWWSVQMDPMEPRAAASSLMPRFIRPGRWKSSPPTCPPPSQKGCIF